MVLYGFHIDSNPDTLLDEIKKVKRIGLKVIQLFVYPYHKNKDIYNKLGDILKGENIKSTVHASYTINLSRDWNEYSAWINQFIDEIEISEKIGSFGIVIHVGKQLELTKEEALNNMLTSLLYIHKKTEKYKVRILIETPSGQGTELLTEIDKLIDFLNKFINSPLKDVRDRFRICLDTCHIFSAGYDIRTKKKILEFLKYFESTIGLRYIGLIHLNDSKTPLDSNLDRHEDIGKGTIGLEAIKMFISFFKELETPFILETPTYDSKIITKLFN